MGYVHIKCSTLDDSTPQSIEEMEDILSSSTNTLNYALNKMGGRVLDTEINRQRISAIQKDLYYRYVVMSGRDPVKEHEDREAECLKNLMGVKLAKYMKVCGRPNISKEQVHAHLNNLLEGRFRSKSSANKLTRYYRCEEADKQACMMLTHIYFNG